MVLYSVVKSHGLADVETMPCRIVIIGDNIYITAELGKENIVLKDY